jgi:predicted amidophosphoribosyltransferase
VRTVLAPPPACPPPLGLDSCRALAAYDDEARALLTGLKNGQQRWLVPVLAARLVALLPEADGLVVTWAPTGPARRRQRGFDQAELLARAVGRRAHLPVVALLRRQAGPAQSGRSGADRRQPAGFSPARAAAGPVVLVDDVTTTGATLVAAARALRAAGAAAIHGVVVARASGPGGR